MNFLARIVRFLFWLVILSWGLRLVRYIVGGMLRNSQAPAPETKTPAEGIAAPSSARRLVRDPVCGIHVDETRSIPLRDGGALRHFCSPACRDAYAATVKKLAANG
jgi:YHS domain-containing protein